MSIEFANTSKGMELLGAYVSELIRQGVTFSMNQDSHAVRVTLTGGF